MNEIRNIPISKLIEILSKTKMCFVAMTIQGEINRRLEIARNHNPRLMYYYRSLGL